VGYRVIDQRLINGIQNTLVWVVNIVDGGLNRHTKWRNLKVVIIDWWKG